MDLLDDPGLRPIVNGVGPATRLGGLPLADEVWEAMRAVFRHPVRLDELQVAAGARLSALLGVPACYVTSGASAALHLATTIALTRGDEAAIDHLPFPAGARTTVVIQKAHRDPYDRAVEQAGARLLEIGYPGSTHPGELARVLDETVAAVVFRPGRHGDLLPLSEVAAIAHAHDVPVIVDGALHTPPVERLQGFLADGADLVAVSGGKGFRGPQASGLLCGTADWVPLAGVHQQDMDERPSTWAPAVARTSPTPPRHGPSRPMKVGREQLAGLVAAVERYLRDPGADERPGIAELDRAEAALRAAGVDVERVHDDALDVPTLRISAPGGRSGADAVARALTARPRPVILGEAEAWDGVLTVNPMGLLPGHGGLLAAAVIETVDRLTGKES
jgi:L-seryl-tRNA(Ser) seleniumtransferase